MNSRKLLSAVFRFTLGVALVFLIVTAYLVLAPFFQRNALEMVTGPILDTGRLLGPDSRLESPLKWEWKAPLSIAVPKRVENCSSSQSLQTAARLELLTVDSLCNVSAHKNSEEYLVRCRHPFSSDTHTCFATAYVGGLGFDWKRQSFERGVIVLRAGSHLREVTPMLALDQRVSVLSTFETYSRSLNGSFHQSPSQLAEYVKSTNSKLRTGTFKDFSKYALEVHRQWNFEKEFWDDPSAPGTKRNLGQSDEFQEKFQVEVAR